MAFASQDSIAKNAIKKERMQQFKALEKTAYNKITATA